MAPLPNQRALRRREPLRVERVLPAAGRPGPPPPWPGTRKPTAAERAKWASLWRLPQAVAWEDLQMIDPVYNYCRLWVAFHRDLDAGEAKSAMAVALRQAGDKLGLDPAAMVRLKWQIEGGDVSGQSQRPWADVMTLKVAQRRRVAAVDPALIRDEGESQ